VYQLLLFFHIRPANQRTTVGVVLCQKVGSPWSKLYHDHTDWTESDYVIQTRNQSRRYGTMHMPLLRLRTWDGNIAK